MTQSHATRRPAHLALLLRLTTATAALLLMAAALLHLVRSSESNSLRAPGLLLAAVTCGAAALLARGVWCGSRNSATRTGIAVACATTLFVVLCGASLSTAAETPATMAAIWILLLTCECCSWLAFARPDWLTRRPGGAVGSSAANETGAAAPWTTALQSQAEIAGNDESDLLHDDQVVQQFTRSRCDENGEFIHGLIRCRFVPGERTQVEHVAFCPPLEGPPSILVDQVEGPPARLKVAQAETFGARFEIRLERTCRRASDVVVEFFVSTADESERSQVA